MTPRPSSKRNTSNAKNTVPTASAILPDATLVEMIHTPVQCKTSFAIWKKNNWQEKNKITDYGRTLVPYTASNALIKNNVVLFPGEPVDYGDQRQLIEEIRSFIHRYVALSDGFEEIATYFVLLTWVYDRFNELPYLRVKGDYGTGKTRFLKTAGSICYRPIIASGASTVSPIFHLLDQFRGTLVIDEADFRFSDETAEITKILNCGNTRGAPVLRCQITKAREFEPRVFQVFGPKIVATRKSYKDNALESRFITEHTSEKSVRAEIPVTLPQSFDEEALALRNKLLMYRFRNWHRINSKSELPKIKLDARYRQITLPFFALIDKVDHGHMAEMLHQHIAMRGPTITSKLWSNDIVW